MNLTTLTTLLGGAVAGAIAWSLGGREGLGVLLGFLAGASCAGVCVALQRRVARARPAFLVHAVLGGFLFKACAMLGLTLALRFVAPLREAGDAVSFLFAFAATAIAILFPATIDTVKALDNARLLDSDRTGARSLSLSEGRAP